MKKYITLAIMLTLMDGKTYKAKELSDKFETSVKTIYRSIETLIEAGMPLTVSQGRNGGVSLIDASLISSGFFTSSELCSFLSFALSNPNKFCSQNQSLIERFKSANIKKTKQSIYEKSQHLVIDTDIWGTSGNFKNYYNQISSSIEDHTKLKICYQSLNNIFYNRTIHPYALVFKAGAWYVYSYCEVKNDFRLFKLSRIITIENTSELFERKNIDLMSKPWNKSFIETHQNIDIILEVEDTIISDFYDWFGTEIKCNKVSQNKSQIKVKATYSFGLIHRLMQYGNKVKVIYPEYLAKNVVIECQSICNAYSFA